MAEQLLMNTTALRRSPLTHLAEDMSRASEAGKGAAALAELPFQTMVTLRVDPASAAAEALVAAVGVPLPGRHGEVSGSAGGRALLWMGPDEFLLAAPEGDNPTADLVAALGDAPGAVVDISASRTTLLLTGSGARTVLEKGCPIDLHPREFPAGAAVATTLGPVPVFLWRTDANAWRIMPRASFADYTARWLLDAMAEFTGEATP